MRWHRITSAEAGQRLDTIVSNWLGLSRSQTTNLIKSGQVRLDGGQVKPSISPKTGDRLSFRPMVMAQARANINLPIVYQDAALLVVDKPAGLVVHPTGASDHQPSVADFASQHTEDTDAARPGIVHRLDKDTSGLLIIAKSAAAKAQLQKQFRLRQVGKQYIALVQGYLAKTEAEINLPIAAGTGVKRVVHPSGRTALTRYQVTRRYHKASLLNVSIESGRTHQIRVHLAAIGHPVVGDTTYGTAELPLGRQFLHAHKLDFISPTGQSVSLTSPLPADLKDYLKRLK